MRKKAGFFPIRETIVASAAAVALLWALWPSLLLLPRHITVITSVTATITAMTPPAGATGIPTDTGTTIIIPNITTIIMTMITTTIMTMITITIITIIIIMIIMTHDHGHGHD